MPSLEFDTVTKRFGALTVLDGLSLRVEDAETVAVIGPSGGGKTVLLRLLAGVEEPDAGRILIDGEDAADVPPEGRGIGMAFQNFALFPHMSAFDNIASPLEAKRSSVETIQGAVRAVARLLKIEHVLSHAPRELSNGQKQRAALGRALAAEPKILLLDDPLRNVDAKLRFEMRLELPRLLARYGSTVLYVTQDYKEAMALGDRIAVLDEGRFVQVGTPQEIYLTPATLGVARLFGDPTINVLPVRPEAGSVGADAQIAGTRVNLGDAHALAVGRDCTLGVRPEALDYCAADDVNAVPLRVEAVTPLNEKVVTLLSGPDGLELLASRPSTETPPSAGDLIPLRIAPQSVLLFDAAPGTAPPGRPA